MSLKSSVGLGADEGKPIWLKEPMSFMVWSNVCVDSGGRERDLLVALQSMETRERDRLMARQSIGTTLYK